MNFDEAITAHSQWKIRLQGVVAGTSKENLDPGVVGLDNKCILGQWIHGEARQFAHHPEYSKLVSEHAAFHQCAADVLRTITAGKAEQAKAMIDNGAFHEASIRTINAIRHLRKKVQD